MKEESQKKQKSKKSHDCSASVHAEIIIEENINKVWEVLRVFKLSSINFCFFFLQIKIINTYLFTRISSATKNGTLLLLRYISMTIMKSTKNSKWKSF